MKDARITVRFSKELRRRLKVAARLGGRRESELIRSAVERLLSVESSVPTAYELAKTAGLIGIARGASGDLSTNAKYFDGFGEP